MKKKFFPLLVLMVALGLSACGNASGMDKKVLELPTQAAETDDEAAAYSAPALAPDGGDGEGGNLEECALAPAGENNVLEHEEAGYCGNTITTVSRETGMGGEPWEASFAGSDSVALTDLLRYLDYSGDICRCLPEYNVDTEFGKGYGINLTEGYARYDGGQTPLTEEQIEQIGEIIARQAE